MGPSGKDNSVDSDGTFSSLGSRLGGGPEERQNPCLAWRATMCEGPRLTSCFPFHGSHPSAPQVAVFPKLCYLWRARVMFVLLPVFCLFMCCRSSEHAVANLFVPRVFLASSASPAALGLRWCYGPHIFIFFGWSPALNIASRAGKHLPGSVLSIVGLRVGSWRHYFMQRFCNTRTGGLADEIRDLYVCDSFS